MLFFFALRVSDPSKTMLQSCVMIACTCHAGAGSTRDRRFSFPKDPHRRALWIATVQQKDLEPKTKKDGRVRGRHFLSGKPFSDESHSDFTPYVRVVRSSAKTNAGCRPGRTSWPVQAFCRTISDRESPPWHRSASTLPKFIFKTSRLSHSTSSPANTVVNVREQLGDAICRLRSTGSGQTRHSTIKNHRLGIALPELYLKDILHCTSVFFFSKQVNFPTRPVHLRTLWSLCESSLTTRCRLRSTGSGAEPTLNPTVSDKQSSKLRLVKISRLASNGETSQIPSKS